MSDERSRESVDEAMQSIDEEGPMALFHPGSDRRLQRFMKVIEVIILTTIVPALGGGIAFIAYAAS